MSKTQEPKSRPKGTAAHKPAATESSTPPQRRMSDSIRETVESVVIAFVLAFLFRTFEAEAFVIPTGSMATTLRGQHKDLKCSNCKFPYLVSASEEEPSEREAPKTKQQLAEFQYNHEVVSCVCPNCGFVMDFEDGTPPPPKSFKGDRILVGKFAYEFSDPKRWDVAVFHFPHEAHQNYIKRLVGQPNETVVIYRGDLLTASVDVDVPHNLNAQRVDRLQREAKLVIQRKPPDKVQAMLQVVYDNEFALPQAPRRWQAAPGAAWEASDDGHAFETDGAAPGDEMLVYRHLMPSPDFWDPQPGHGPKYNPDFAPPQLITDNYGYNGGTLRTNVGNGPDHGECWVSDLAFDCHVEIKAGEGELVLGLVEADCLFECRIDVATGEARFSSSADAAFQPHASTKLRGPGKHRLQFANVDEQLLLWVDGKAVLQAPFEPLDRRQPGDEDLTPVRFGSRGAQVCVDHLRVLRDVYYRAANRGNSNNEDYGARYLEQIGAGSFDPRRDDWKWDRASWRRLFADAPAVSFKLGREEFMMLGDNSPRSSDSRLWDARRFDRHRDEPPLHVVHRDLLIGKALYIYWPHALDHLPGTDVWFPFFPDFARMRLVR